eukprot:TRINITY_DN3057_c0_g1_i1.p1 TRINITY_DN3057_c0_g1~~TRINITY_DN3057_c0_g1_i1.p1  ORF type:complete len:947 (-),score=201.21 TRINITY_DN3057_c0_g1_i1:112-2952(-)
MAFEVKFTFTGDVDALSAQISHTISEMGGTPAVVTVSMPEKSTPVGDAAGHLQEFRKLIRLSPFPVVCDISAKKLSPLDVVVALTCDLIKCTQKRVALSAEDGDSLLQTAKKHWQFFSGEQMGSRLMLDFSHVDCGMTSSSDRNVVGFLPHYWMAFRNVGMAAGTYMPMLKEGEKIDSSLLKLTKAGESVARLTGIFNFYFGPKIASIFAAGDVLQGGSACTSFMGQIEEYAGQLAAAKADDSKARQAIENVVKVVRCTVDTVEVTLTSDILYANLGEVTKLLAVISDKNVQRVHFRLEDGMLTDAGSILPRENETHMLIYKWHRKWEQLLSFTHTKKVLCTLVGSQICPPLLELFFSAEERVWASPSRQLVWCKIPFAYSPGPEALQGGLRGLPISSLRKLLSTGLSVEEAVDLRLVKLTTPGPKKAILPDTHASAIAGDVIRVARPSLKRLATSANVQQDRPNMKTWVWGGGRLDLPKQARCQVAAKTGSCSLLGYGLAVPEEFKATQAEIATMLGVKKEDKRDWSILTASHIKTRYLAELGADLKEPEKIDLTHNNAKHLKWAQKLLVEAIHKACADAGISPSQVGHVTVANSTGYLLPGLTAYVVKDKSLGIPKTVAREDVIGMGCHAGLNSLKSAASWACANPGKYAISCGVEICSAQYVWGKDTCKQLNTVIVNSLFGDGCFCSVLRASPEGETRPPPAYIDMPPSWWMQLCDTGALEDMIYNVESSEDKYRFDLSELAPYHVGQGLFTMMQHALQAEIPVHLAKHVVTHTGGKTVLDCSAVALGLEGVPAQSLPYTVQALRDYGNQSSCSILFAFHNLVQSGDVYAGDNGVLITMGPGAGLEMSMFTAGSRFPMRSEAAELQLLRTQSTLLSMEDLLAPQEHDFQEEDWLLAEPSCRLSELSDRRDTTSDKAEHESTGSANGKSESLWRRILLAMKVCG